MFTNERRISVGLGGILTVGLTIVAYLVAAGLMFQTYADGRAPKLTVDGCQMMCRAPSEVLKNG